MADIAKAVPSPSLTNMTQIGQRFFKHFQLYAVIKASLPVTELKTHSKEELVAMVNGNFKSIVMKANFEELGGVMKIDVPVAGEFLLIKQVCLHKWIDNGDVKCQKVSYFYRD